LIGTRVWYGCSFHTVASGSGAANEIEPQFPPGGDQRLPSPAVVSSLSAIPSKEIREPLMAISVRNLDAPLGAEVSGVDLAKPLPQGDVDAVAEAWRMRLVVVFCGQTLSDPQLLAFSRYFGELDPPGPNPYGEPFNKAHPEINVISNVVENGKPIGNLGDGEAVWHADMTYVDVPPKAAILYPSKCRSAAAIRISRTCLQPTAPCRRN
jgi:Taurine catabolism dioxygenase TauD, TfdA family